MAKITTFGVFAVYKDPDGNLGVRPPMPFLTAEKAISVIRASSALLGGAIAYSKVVDDETAASEDDQRGRGRLEAKAVAIPFGAAGRKPVDAPSDDKDGRKTARHQ